MRDLLKVHRNLLERRRSSMNLVGPGDVGVHYEDSRKALDGVEVSGRWADLGTGAGFPGVVLAAMYPDATVELVDSRRKRCVFLEQVLAEAGVGDRVTVRCMRVEDLEDGAYDGVTAKAFAPADEVVSQARRLLKPGGRVVLFLQDDGEVPTADGFHVERENRYVVDGKGRRAVVLRRA